MAGEGDEGGGGGGWEGSFKGAKSLGNTNVTIPNFLSCSVLGGSLIFYLLISGMWSEEDYFCDGPALANTLIVSIRKVDVCRN